jgi:hypothetical protein
MKKIMWTIATVTLITVALWGFGFWTPSASIYWRRPAQTTLLVTGRILPRFLSRRVTDLALRTHLEATSTREIEFASNTFRKIRENKRAALLERTLVREAVTNSELEEAVVHAKHSHQLAPDTPVIVDLVKLTIKKPEAPEWITLLQQVDPGHELSQATLCRSELSSFDNEIPVSCRQVQWVAETAAASESEYNDLVEQIRDLPAERRRKIAEYEADIATEEVKRSQNYAEVQDIERQKSEVVAATAVEIGIDILPLPKPGDSVGEYVVREGLCLLPFIRVLCAFNSAAGPLERMKKRLDGLNELRRLNEVLIGYNNQAIQYNREQIAYWQSEQPLEELNKKKDNVVPKFANNITETIWSRKQTTGLTLTEAISQMSL